MFILRWGHHKKGVGTPDIKSAICCDRSLGECVGGINNNNNNNKRGLFSDAILVLTQTGVNTGNNSLFTNNYKMLRVWPFFGW